MDQSEREKKLDQAFQEVQTGMSILEKKPMTALEKDVLIERFCEEAFATMNTPNVADGLGGGAYGLVRDLVRTYEILANNMVKEKSARKRTVKSRVVLQLLRRRTKEGHDDGEKGPSTEPRRY